MGSLPSAMAAREGFDEAFGGIEVGADVATLADEHGAGIFEAGGDVVLVEELFDAAAVRNDVAFEAILIAETIDEEFVARGHGDAVVIVVGIHGTHQASLFDDAAPGVEVEHFDFLQGDMGIGRRRHRGAFGFAVDGEVFGGAGDALGLEGLHLSDAKFGDEIGVFAVGFDDAAPSGVAGEVEDGE